MKTIRLLSAAAVFSAGTLAPDVVRPHSSEVVQLCFDKEASTVKQAVNRGAGCASEIEVGPDTQTTYELLATRPRRLKEWTFVSLNVEMNSSDNFGPSLKVIDSFGVEHQSSPYVNKLGWSSHTINLPAGVTDKIVLSFEPGSRPSRFRGLRIKFTADDRFEGIPQYEFRFRERFTNKGARTRILIVGNSTIRGTCSNVQDTIPYLLQSKLDFYSPDKYEVLNYGIGSWFLASQVLAVKDTVVNVWPLDHLSILNNDLTFTDDIKTLDQFAAIKQSRKTILQLQPDIVILSSLWNDINHILARTHKVSCVDTRAYDDCIRRQGNYCDQQIPLISYYDKLYKYAASRSLENEFEVVRELQKDRSCVTDDDVSTQSLIVAQRTYRWLLEQFISRLDRRRVKIIFMSLPFRGEGKLASVLATNRQYMARGSAMSERPVEIDEYYERFETVAQIQNEAMEMVGKQLKIPYIDMSAVARSRFSGASDDVYISSDLFCDPAHFTERGSEFIVDNLYQPLMAEIGVHTKR